MRVALKVGEKLEGVYLLPSNAQPWEVLKQLRVELPNLPVRATPTGLLVASSDAHKIPRDIKGIEMVWSREAEAFVHNRAMSRSMHLTTLRVVEELKTGSRDLAMTFLSEISSDLQLLDDHQVVNVAAMTLPGSVGMCVFDEQGAGKTVTAIYAFDVLVERGEANFLLIIAPKSMVPEWPTDFARFKGDLYNVKTLGRGSNSIDILSEGPDVLVTNFESAIRYFAELKSFLASLGGTAVIVVDESFFIKNPDAKRTMAIKQLREWCKRAFVLCGTPAPNSALDVVEQFSLTDFGVSLGSTSLTGTETEIHNAIREAVERNGIFTRHLKSQVLAHLPDKHFHRVLLDMMPQQRSLYQEILTGLVSDLRNTTDSEFGRNIVSFMAKRSRLLQVCSNPARLFEDYSETSAKLLALDSILDRAIGQNGEKVIVWSFYRGSLEAIERRYQRYSPVRYDGSVNDTAERRELVRRFQEDDSTMLFVGNPAAAGAGLTLHRARLAIYESWSNQAAHYLQSVDRIHRRGQDRTVEYAILLCKDTIELDEYDRLINKQQAAQQLLGDPSDQTLTRNAMLEEAMRSLESLGLN